MQKASGAQPLQQSDGKRLAESVRGHCVVWSPATGAIVTVNPIRQLDASHAFEVEDHSSRLPSA
jgi:hypothetical protein